MVNDGNIFVYDYTGGDNQKFYIIPVDGYYKLVAKNSYLNFDNSYDRLTPGNNIMQVEDNGCRAQRWSITSNNPPLSLSKTSLTLNPNNSETVNCTIGRNTNGITISYSIANSSVCSAKWNGWSNMTDPLTITGKNEGTTTITVVLKDIDTGIVLVNKTITVTVHDTTKPNASISSTNNVSASQTVTLSMSDNSGLAGYYWGTNSSYSSNTYTAVSGTSKSVTKTVSSSGTYYLTVKDNEGNISTTVSKVFYKTILNANGGSVSTTSIITMNGNSFVLPTGVRGLYNYSGWNTKADGSGTAYAADASYKPTGNANIFAQWTPNTYFTTFDMNRDGINPNLFSSSEETDETREINSIRYYRWSDGEFEFDGYSTTASPAPANNTFSNEPFKAEATTYTITIERLSGSADINKSSFVLELGGIKPLSQRYYVNFIGSKSATWCVSVADAALIDKVILWKWVDTGGYLKANSLSFRIKIEKGKISTEYSNECCATEIGGRISCKSPAITYPGYSFEEWNTKADGSGTDYSGTIIPVDNMTLYPKWSPNTYCVKFNGNGATGGEMKEQRIVYDEEAKLAKNAFVNDNCGEIILNYLGGTSEQGEDSTHIFDCSSEFCGWSYNNHIYNDEQTVKNLTTIGTITLTANWVQTVVLPNVAPRDGYVFIGWKDDNSDIIYKPGDTYQALNNKSRLFLYAVWIPLSYTVTFDANGGLIEGNPTKTFTVERCSYITTPIPVREEYEFIGWKTADSYDEEGNVGSSLSPIHDLTIIALWKKTKFTATFYIDNNPVSVQQYTYDTESLEEPEIPPKPYTISGRWDYSLKDGKDLDIYPVYESPKVTINTAPYLSVGDNYKLSSKSNFEAEKTYYYSNNQSVATVDSNGVITVKDKGPCTVSVTKYGKDSFGNEIKSTGHIDLNIVGESPSYVDSEDVKKVEIENFFVKLLLNLTSFFKRLGAYLSPFIR